jgi:protein-S-isoprenylcysteine O-methyltransferase Ste14
MSEPPPLPQTRGRPSRTGGRVRAISLAALIGAAVGAWFARSGKAPPRWAGHPLSPAFLLTPMAFSLYLWIIMSVYWEVAARNASATRSAESRGSRALHLLIVNVAMVLSFWPFAGWPRPAAPAFEFPRVLPDAPYLAPLGLTLATGCLLLALWARRILGRNWSGAVTVKVDHALVRGGPYRRIRHPIYTGAIGMYVGTALISGRLQGPIAIALVGIAYARKIGQEERALREVFGAAYDEYRGESWALIPWIL